ncbi:type II toxin-antitoxin system PemK/MazF family toxin [Bacillus cereus]
MTGTETETETVEFKRGDVFYVNFSEVVYDSANKDHVKGRPLPHTILQGLHMAIVLSNDEKHDGVELSTNHVLVVPISESKTAAERGELLITHVPLEKEKNEFLKKKSYALVFQPIPVPIHWLREGKRRGEVDPGDMELVTRGLIMSTGSAEHVNKFIDEAVAEALSEFGQSSSEGPASSDE